MKEGKALVCFAMPDEARFFKRSAVAARVHVLVHGIGKQNAKHAICAALTKSPLKFVLTCGFAGGLEPKLVHGDVLFSTDDSELRSRLLTAGGHEGKFFCADRIAVTAEEKWALWQKTGADAVEMESEIIRAICREQKIPSATVRVISDIAGEDLPLDFNQLAKSDQSLDFVKLAFGVAKSPGKIPALMRLQKQTSAAARKLAQVLEKIISA